MQVRFGVTGDDETEFLLLNDQSASNLILQSYIDGYTGTTHLGKYPSQISEYITLQADEYYYFELRHIEG